MSQSPESQPGPGPTAEFHPAFSLKAEDIESPEPPVERLPFTAKELTRISFESFRFSQGDPEMHSYMLRYIRLAEGDRIKDDLLEQSMPALEKRAGSFISHGANKTHGPDPIATGVSFGGVPGEIKRIRGDWENAKTDQPNDMPWILERLVALSIANDYLWTINKGGRPRSEQDSDGDAQPDSKYLSQFAFYGLARHTTNVPEYDAMFDRMVKTLDEDEYLRNQVNSQLRSVISTYLEHYPGELDLLPPQWRPEAEMQEAA